MLSILHNREAAIEEVPLALRHAGAVACDGPIAGVVSNAPVASTPATKDSGLNAASPWPRMIDDPDSELVERAVAGDRDAFGNLLERHYDRIHRIAWRMTGSDTDAQDIAQDVCCTLVEKIDSFKGEAKFTTWLTGIVVNACRDHHRRNAIWTRVKGGLSVLANLARQPDGRDLYRQSSIATGLSRLKPPLRETFVLVASEDLSHAEAAHVLGVAESTVSWRIHEARKQLSVQFSGEM